MALRFQYLKKVVTVAMLATLLFLLGAQVSSATTITHSMSGTSYADCPDSYLDTGINSPSGTAGVTSGVSGISSTYTLPKPPTPGADLANIHEFTYTLSASLANPAYERVEKVGPGSFQHPVEYKCYPVEDPIDGSYQSYTGVISIMGDVSSVTFGSYSVSSVSMLHNSNRGTDAYNRMSQFTTDHSITLDQHIKGPKSISHTATGNFSNEGVSANESYGTSGSGTVISATVYAQSYVVASDGSYIAGPFDPIGESCGADLTYPNGVTNPVGSATRRTNRAVNHIDVDQPANSYTSTNIDTVALPINSARLLGSRSAIYYNVPQFLIDRSVCSPTTVFWTNQTVYGCSMSAAPAGDPASIVAANPGSRIETFYGTEASAPAFQFPSYAEMFPGDTPSSVLEGDMKAYAAHAPLNINSCSDGTGGAVPVEPDPTPILTCDMTVAVSENPAIVSVDATWTANVDGASGPIQYVWTGSDALSRDVTLTATSDSVDQKYDTAGTKNAQVIVRSGGQEAVCTNSTVMYKPLSGSCYPTPSRTAAPASITWRIANLDGGNGSYTYQWVGDGLSSTAATAVGYYTTAGTKNASVTVTDTLGQAVTLNCSQAVVEPTAPSTYDLTASVVGQCRINSSDGGISCGADCNQSYTSGTSVGLTVTASPESAFVGWGGDCSGAPGTSCSLTMSDDKYVSAQCTPLPSRDFTVSADNQCAVGEDNVEISWTSSQYATGYLITRSKDGGSPVPLYPNRTTIPYRGGTLDVGSPANIRSFTDSGLDAGSTYTYQVFAINEYGLAVPDTTKQVVNVTPAVACTLNCTISATNNNTKAPTNSSVSIDSVTGTAIGEDVYGITCGGGNFTAGVANNSSGSCSFTTPGSYTVRGAVNRGGQTAVCTTPVTVLEGDKSLTTSATGCTITSAPAGIICGTGGTDCAQNYAHGTSVTLTATPDANYRIASWSGSCAGTGGTCNLSMTANRSASVQCVPDGPTVAPACTLDLQVQDAGSVWNNGVVTLPFGTNVSLRWDATNVAGDATAGGSPVLSGWTGAQTAPDGISTKTITLATPTSPIYSLTLTGVNNDAVQCSDSVGVAYTPGTSVAPNIVTTCAPDNVSKNILSWNKANKLADKVMVFGGATGSEIALGYATCSSDSCSFTHTNLTEGSLYTYRLRNENGNGYATLSSSRSQEAAVCPVTLTGTPDLTVTSLNEKPATTHYVGDTVTLEAVIKNIDKDASGTWQDRFYVKAPSAPSIGTYGIPAQSHTDLGAGMQYTAESTSFTLTEAGTWQIAFTTDSGTALTETSEVNNSRVKTFTVSGGGTETTPTCTLTASPASATPDSLITWTAQITDGGNGTYTYNWKYDDGTHWTSEPNVTSAVSQKFDTYGADGTYTPSVEVVSGGLTGTCTGSVVITPDPVDDFWCSVGVTAVGTLDVEYVTTVTDSTNNGTYNYAWSGSLSDSVGPTSQLSVTRNHTYGSEGQKVINAQVTRGDGEVTNCSTVATLSSSNFTISCHYEFDWPTGRTLPLGTTYATTSGAGINSTTYPNTWGNYRVDWRLGIDHEVSGVQTPSDYEYDILFYTRPGVGSGWSRERSFLVAGIDDFRYTIPFDFDQSDLPTTTSPFVRLRDNNQVPAVYSNTAICPTVNILSDLPPPPVIDPPDFDYNFDAPDVVVAPGSYTDKTITLVQTDLDAIPELITLSVTSLPDGMSVLYYANDDDCTPDAGGTCEVTIRYVADAAATPVTDHVAYLNGNSPTTAQKTKPFFITITGGTPTPATDVWITDITKNVVGGTEKVRRGRSVVGQWNTTGGVGNVLCDITGDVLGALVTGGPASGVFNTGIVNENDTLTLSCVDDNGDMPADYLNIEVFSGPPDFEEF